SFEIRSPRKFGMVDAILVIKANEETRCDDFINSPTSSATRNGDRISVNRLNEDSGHREILVREPLKSRRQTTPIESRATTFLFPDDTEAVLPQHCDVVRVRSTVDEVGAAPSHESPQALAVSPMAIPLIGRRVAAEVDLMRHPTGCTQPLSHRRISLIDLV